MEGGELRVEGLGCTPEGYEGQGLRVQGLNCTPSWCLAARGLGYGWRSWVGVRGGGSGVKGEGSMGLHQSYRVDTVWRCTQRISGTTHCIFNPSGTPRQIRHVIIQVSEVKDTCEILQLQSVISHHLCLRPPYRSGIFGTYPGI